MQEEQFPLFSSDQEVQEREGAWWLCAANEILDEAERDLGWSKLRAIDAASRWWLEKKHPDFAANIAAEAAMIKRPGIHLLNLSLEWGCTARIERLSNDSMRMRRVFDWGPQSLGSTLMAVRRMRSNGGHYWSLTWPMFIGEITTVVPSRFSIAVNAVHGYRSKIGKVVIPKFLEETRRMSQMVLADVTPAALLVRQVTRQAETSEEAIQSILEARICTPAIFVVVGPTPEASGVIEHLGGSAYVRRGLKTVANRLVHFGACYDLADQADSTAREQAMMTSMGQGSISTWCVPPILRSNTRFAAEIPIHGEAMRIQRYVAGLPWGKEILIDLSAHGKTNTAVISSLNRE